MKRRFPGPHSLLQDLPFEEYQPEVLLDPRGQYRMNLDTVFPFTVKLFTYRPQRYRLHYHERLEIAFLLDDEAVFQAGEKRFPCRPCDIVVVNSAQRHSFVDFRRGLNRAVVISFLPTFICQPGSSPEDLTFLAPFYFAEDNSPVVRSREPYLRKALDHLVGCWFRPGPQAEKRAGVKAYLLEILYLLARHYSASAASVQELTRRRKQAARLNGLVSHLHERLAEHITINQAAEIAGMSRSRFTAFFRKAAGMSFVSYRTRVCLAEALRLLQQSDLTIAEIASATGFSDQSYLDRRFVQMYGKRPSDVRRGSRAQERDSAL